MRSSLERMFEGLLMKWRLAGVFDFEPPETEYAFDGMRRWRLDFAWPARKVAVEIEGGVWSRGRHTRGTGFIADCDKYNAAAVMGWKVLRFTEAHFSDERRMRALVVCAIRGLESLNAIGDEPCTAET